MGRAEKRRLIAEQFDWSQNSLKRRRPQLGRPTPGVDQSLNGPPLRTIFSPVPASPKPRSNAAKSARIPPSSIPSSPAAAAGADTSKTSENLVHTNANSNAFSSLSGVLGFNNMPLHKHNPQKLDYSSTSRASTASTLPLNSSPIRPIEKDLPLLVSRPETAAAAQVVSASASFQFSMPSPASALTGKKSRRIDEEDVAVPNGILFSFCQPAEAASPSLNSGNQNNSALAPPSLLPVTNFTSTSSRSDISLHKNHTALPDLTMRSALAKAPSDGDNGINNSGGAIIPAKSLKRGSVLDVLNRDHSLPDVTASTGIKVANKFSNDNVMMQVRGGHFK